MRDCSNISEGKPNAFRRVKGFLSGAVRTFPSLAVSFAIAFAVIPALGTEADAQSRACKRLQVQLTSLSRGGGKRNSRSFRKYDKAVKSQQVQIERAKSLLRQRRCIGLFAGFARPSSCGALSGNLKKMQGNLAKLTAKRASFSARGGSTKSQRRRIQRAMLRNKCNGNSYASLKKRKKNDRRTIMEQIFGAQGQRNRQYGQSGNGVSRYALGRRGTYRTLCVRTCDGYYFPISYSTSPRMFDRDVQACSAMCPGSTTQLYYQSAGAEDAENMTSVETDQPYSELPTAFAYREKVNEDCSCTAAKGADPNYETVAGEADPEREERLRKEREASIGVPMSRPDPGEDPETLANLQGGLSLNSFASIPQKGEMVSGIASPRVRKKVRIVGDVFFPVQ